MKKVRCRNRCLRLRPTHLHSCLDSLITVRIQNDEKALRRVARKFHTYSCLAHTPLVPSPTHEKLGSAEDAREAFLIELASFQLTLKKSAMICEAEIRQVQEYEQEKARIGGYCFRRREVLT